MKHEPIVSSSAAYYIYSFGASDAIDPNLIAHRLLSSQLAETMSSPSTDEIMLAPRFRDLARLNRKAKALDDLRKTTDWHSLRTWSRRHPLLASRILGGIVWDKIRHNASDAAGVQGEDDGPGPDMGQVSDEIEERVADAQVSLAIQHWVESKLFREKYRDGEPYLRLHLRHTLQWWKHSTDVDENADPVVMDALLMVHHSGVMQLTLGVPLPHDLGPSELVQYGYAKHSSLAACTIPEPLLAGGLGKEAHRALGEWQEAVEAGVRWRRMQHETPTTVTDVFELYRESISKAAGVKLDSEWFCYPVLCLDELACCGSESEWRSNHAADLKGIVMRVPDPSVLRAGAFDDAMSKDMSHVSRASTYFHEGGETVISWHGSSNPASLENRMWHILVTESALLEYWQLGLLESRLADTIGSLKRVAPIQEQAIFGLREFRDGRLSYGSANDLVQHLLNLWGVERRYSMIMESLSQLQDRFANDRALMAARRANLMAGLAVLLAIVFGLPAIDQAFEVIRRLPNVGLTEPLVGPLRSIASKGDAGVWLSYLVVAAAVVLAAVGSALVRRLRVAPRLARRRRSAGYVWPLGSVRLQERGDVERPDPPASGPFSLG